MLRFIRNKIYDTIYWFRISYNSFLMFSAALIGILAGYGSVVFIRLTEFATHLSIGSDNNFIQTLSALNWWYILLVLFIGGALVGPLVNFFAKETKGHGVPEVMEAIALRGGKIRPRVVFIKAIASAITLGTGGSVGREGPIVQIGSAAGSMLGQWLKVPTEHLRVLVACGAAGGIAAVFNAPIAGVMFSVEIILGDYAITTLAPMVLSSVLATIISHAYLGSQPSFSIPAYKMVHPYEIIPYIFLAILCAFVARAFVRILYYIEDRVNDIKFPEALKTPIGFVLVGLIILVFPQLFGDGYETMENIFDEKILWSSLLMLSFFKIIASSVTLAVGGSGGVFAPSLFIGATFGGAYGQIVHWLFPEFTNISSPYAVVGMAAVVAGATHAPLTAFLIIFEMTADYHLILPLMIGALFSSYLTTYLAKTNIYTLKLLRRGIDLSKGMETSVMQAVKVDEVMSRNVKTLTADMPFTAMVQEMLTSRASNYYVTAKDGTFIGSITTQSMKEMLSHRDTLEYLLVAGDVADPMKKGIVYFDSSLADCMEKFTRFQAEELPVLDNKQERKFIGSISQKDIIAVYNREIMRRKADGVKLIQRVDGRVTQSHYVFIPGDLEMKEIVILGNLVGKTLAELDVRNSYRVTVVAVGNPGEERTSITNLPDPYEPLKKGQRLFIVGAKADLDNFAAFVRRTRKTA